MKKYFLTILFFCISFHSFSKNDSCYISINLTNKDSFEIFYIQEGQDFIYDDTIGLSSNILLYKAEEPRISFALINNDIDYVKRFFIHSGTFSINIDVGKRQFNFENSPLNSEKNKLADTQRDTLQTLTIRQKTKEKPTLRKIKRGAIQLTKPTLLHHI